MSAKIINRRNHKTIVENALVATSFRQRTVGLIGKSYLLPGEALVLTKCRIIHMLFMKFPIDALFCASDNTIVHICSSLKPWQISPLVWKAQYVVELESNRAKLLDIRVGDVIDFIDGK